MPRPGNFDDIMAEVLPPRAETVKQMGRHIESKPAGTYKTLAEKQADEVIAQLRNMLANSRVRVSELEQENDKLRAELISFGCHPATV